MLLQAAQRPTLIRFGFSVLRGMGRVLRDNATYFCVFVHAADIQTANINVGIFVGVCILSLVFVDK